MSYLEDLKTINTNNANHVDELSAKISELVSAKEEHDAKYYSFVEQMSTEQNMTIENIKSHFNARLISEFEKYNELQNLLEDTIRDYEGYA